jgi:hypothetical protein
MHHCTSPLACPGAPLHFSSVFLRSDSVFVHPQNALDDAFRAFADDLRGIARDTLLFSVTVLVGTKHKSVQIAPGAWPSVVRPPRGSERRSR